MKVAGTASSVPTAFVAVRRRGDGDRGTAAAILSLLSFTAYTTVGLARYNEGRAGSFDLGIFSQGAKSWSLGHSPSSAIRQFPTLLGDHFSPITAVFGVGWRMWPDPRSLLIIQALCLAAAVGVVTAAAVRSLGNSGGMLVGIGLAAGQQVAGAVGFDVHEVCFAVPLLACLCLGVRDHRWRLVLWVSVVLLLVKEDFGLTVLAVAAVWWWRYRERRHAIQLAVTGLAGFLLANSVIMWLNPQHSSPYLQFFVGHGPTAGPSPSLSLVTRLAALSLFMLSAGIVGLRSSLAWLAVPTLAWRLLSSNPLYWSTHLHYDVVLAPVAAVALIEVLSRMRRYAWYPAVAALAAAAVTITVAHAVPTYTRLSLTTATAWRWSDAMRAVAQLSAHVPAGVSIAAENDLGPPLVADYDVRLLSTGLHPVVQWVILRNDDTDQAWLPAHVRRQWIQAEKTRPDTEVWIQGPVTLVHLPTRQTVKVSTDGG